MGLQINTNVTALNALRNLTNVQTTRRSSIEKLSSGLRINQAADDPAGLIISEEPARSDRRSQPGHLQQPGRHQRHQDRGRRPHRSQQPAAQRPPARRSRRQHRRQRPDRRAGRPDPDHAAPSPASSASPSRRSSEPSTCSMARPASPPRSSTPRTSPASTSAARSTTSPRRTEPSTSLSTPWRPALRCRARALATYASINASISTVNGLARAAAARSSSTGSPSRSAVRDTVQTLINKINNLAGTTGVSADFTTRQRLRLHRPDPAELRQQLQHQRERKSPLLTGIRLAHAGHRRERHRHGHRFRAGQRRVTSHRLHLHRRTRRHRQRTESDRYARQLDPADGSGATTRLSPRDGCHRHGGQPAVPGRRQRRSDGQRQPGQHPHHATWATPPSRAEPVAGGRNNHSRGRRMRSRSRTKRSAR